MRNLDPVLLAVLLSALPALRSNAAQPLTIKAVNKLDIARPGQTIELAEKDLGPLGEGNLLSNCLAEGGHSCPQQCVSPALRGKLAPLWPSEAAADRNVRAPS